MFKSTNTVGNVGEKPTSDLCEKSTSALPSELPETRSKEDTSDSTEMVVTADVHQQSTIWSDEITDMESASMS